MKARATLVLGFATLALAAHAFEVRQVFREERFTRGNVNLRPLQAADAADWIWIADGGPAKGEMDAVRFSKDFACGALGERALPVGRSPRDRQLDEGVFENDVPTGTVTLPEGLPGTFLWKGASRPMHVGVNTLRFMEGR